MFARAFLCGDGNGNRKDALYQRTKLVRGEAFPGIQVATYALMDNHFHLVVRFDPHAAHHLSAEEIAHRWLLVQDDAALRMNQDAFQATKKAIASDADRVHRYRQHLSTVGWFMRSIKQPIARMANIDDDCTGAFWEGRYSSIALTDEAAVVACMAYVDLNQVRAGLVDRPEDAVFTGLAERCAARQAGTQGLTHYPQPQAHDEDHRACFADEDSAPTTDCVLPLQDSEPALPLRAGVDDPNDAIDHEPDWLIPINRLFAQQLVSPDTIQFSQANYLELVDQTGRLLKAGKRGAINPRLSPLLKRLSITTEQWQIAHCNKRHIYGTGTYLGTAIGAAREMARRGLKRCIKTWLNPQSLATAPPQ